MDVQEKMQALFLAYLIIYSYLCPNFTGMLEKHPHIRKTLNVSMSLMLGVAILYWMYRDFDFRMVQHTLLHEMNWWWMLASFPFRITRGQVKVPV